MPDLVQPESTRASSAWTARLGSLMAPAGLLALLIGIAVSKPWIAANAPQCVFHRLTGLECPGCGGTRAFFALSRGDLSASLRYNPWALVLVAGLGIWSAKRVIRVFAPWSRWGEPLVMRSSTLWAILVLLVVFAVLRNLPWWPFTLLAPPA
ncbi:DUF2752 domain-containing protein [Luteolibacter sp. LG18]|uniref:DUF2752 domain-containing protein n=1 Tax=Luteolibacter sp. LG18 TaxID=2819286 RepID=UPI002B28AEC5|nr:hypothetical protein llg_24060 [Luteolibacter sp. LG18]